MNLVLRNRLPFAARFNSTPFNEPFDSLMSSMLEDFFSPSLAQEPSVSTPRLNVVDTGQAYEVEAELPGVRKEDVKISVDGRRVSLEAETRNESEKKEGESVVHAERTARKFARMFTLPTELDESQAHARLENGVLLLTLPKKQEVQPKQITVQ